MNEEEANQRCKAAGIPDDYDPYNRWGTDFIPFLEKGEARHLDLIFDPDFAALCLDEDAREKTVTGIESLDTPMTDLFGIPIQNSVLLAYLNQRIATILPHFPQLVDEVDMGDVRALLGSFGFDMVTAGWQLAVRLEDKRVLDG